MKITGVRSPRRTTSSVAPSGRRCFAQPASSSTALSMWPCFFHSGSNIADLFGILMYSTSVGTIDEAYCSSTHFVVASETGMRGLYTIRAVKLIVFGATGGTGRELIAQGVAAGHAVTAFVR